MLDAWASPARDHNISLPHAIALAAVTRDPRLLAHPLGGQGHGVVPRHLLHGTTARQYLDHLHRLMAAARREVRALEAGIAAAERGEDEA